MKQTLQEVPIFSLAFIRFFFASLLLLPFVIKKLKIDRTDILTLILSAILGVTLNIAFFFWGLTLTTAINSGIIIASTPIFTLIFAALFLSEKISKRLIYGVLFGLFGIALIIGKDLFEKGLSLSPFGDFLILIAVLSFVFYEIVSKKLFKKYNSFTITFYSFAIGALSFIPAAFFELKSNPAWILNLSNQATIGILYGVFFSSLAAYSLWQWGLSKIQASRVGFFFYLDPIASTIFAVILLSEKITFPFIFGSVFIILGLFISENNLIYLNSLKKMLKFKFIRQLSLPLTSK
ncbi:MAG: DMT family transporter [Patescibacteria group bacterium]|nr:DMT family transporter [Patescibacteria group bacterium]